MKDKPLQLLIYSIFTLAGDAFVRELDVSKITLRLKGKEDKKGDRDDSDSTVAKVQGSTLDTLQRCLVGLTFLPTHSAPTNALLVQTDRAGAQSPRWIHKQDNGQLKIRPCQNGA